jgi:hypothetical protein
MRSPAHEAWSHMKERVRRRHAIAQAAVNADIEAGVALRDAAASDSEAPLVQPLSLPISLSPLSSVSSLASPPRSHRAHADAKEAAAEAERTALAPLQEQPEDGGASPSQSRSPGLLLHVDEDDEDDDARADHLMLASPFAAAGTQHFGPVSPPVDAALDAAPVPDSGDREGNSNDADAAQEDPVVAVSRNSVSQISNAGHGLVGSLGTSCSDDPGLISELLSKFSEE